MNDYVQQTKNFIEKNSLIKQGDIVLAGVSGGADSVCLFRILNELSGVLGFELVVVHINHMIREEAVTDAEFVEGLCKEKGVRFFRRDIDIPALSEESGESEEEIGRNARYNAFEEIAGELEKESSKRVVIATAHNRNDQAETMLHNLFRGSKLKGLAGIKYSRKRGKHELVRPILMLERNQIEEYLSENGYTWRTDKTNHTDEYTRNRIRHNILPVAIEQVNNGALRHVAETADYLAEVDKYLDDQADLVEEKITTKEKDGFSYDCKELRKTPEIIRHRIYMRGIERTYPHIKDVTAAHILGLDHLIENDEGSARLNLPYHVVANRVYDKLTFSLDKSETSDGDMGDKVEEYVIDKDSLEAGRELKIHCPGIGDVSFRIDFYDKADKIPCGEYTKWFDYDKIKDGILFRKRRAGDTICIGKGRKTLKKFMIDEKIPSNKRNELFVLADGDMILWVPGYRIGSDYKVTEDTSRILEVKIKDHSQCE